MWKQMMVLKLESTWSNKLYETTLQSAQVIQLLSWQWLRGSEFIEAGFLKILEVSRILFIFGHQHLEQKSLFCGKIPTLLPTVVTVGRSPKAAALITPTCAESIPSISLSSNLYFHIFSFGFPSLHTILSFTTWSDFFFVSWAEIFGGWFESCCPCQREVFAN